MRMCMCVRVFILEKGKGIIEHGMDIYRYCRDIIGIGMGMDWGGWEGEETSEAERVRAPRGGGKACEESKGETQNRDETQGLGL